jgi:glycosyltransferase involved in cell wall biosynthesis
VRILFVSPFYDPALADPASSLERFPILRELPAEMRRRGHQVRAIGLSNSEARHVRDGVRYDWLRPPAPLRLPARLAHRWKPHFGPAYYQPSPRLAGLVRRLRPDVLHVFGLTMDLQLLLLTRVAPATTRIFVHYHGGQPPSGRLRFAIQRRAFERIDKALFTSAEQWDAWLAARLLRPDQVAQVIETSSPFSSMPREQARALSGMRGDPVYLSVGRLHPIKDPLTMLRGFATIAERQPHARLYLHYLTGEMLDEARACVASAPGLEQRVEFRGRARPEEMQAIYSSADILLQASLREWSGLAVLEAMSCGCIPVVTRIPSFTAMTGDGAFGRHFEVGDADGLARAALAIEDRAALPARIQRHFHEELSFAAMARRLETLYEAALEPS